MSEAALEGDALIARCRDCLTKGKPVRVDLPGGGRLHIDRKLPFMMLHVLDPERAQLLAREVASSSASYALLSNDPSLAGFHRNLLDAVRQTACEEFEAFFTIELSEAQRPAMERKDAPILPDYDIDLHAGSGRFAGRVADRVKAALEAAEIYYRTPRVTLHGEPDARLFPGLALSLVEPGGWLGVVLPPVYFVPESDQVYPELFDLLVTSALDALLQGLSEFTQAATPLKVAHHGALGRRAFIRAIRAVDRKLDEVARSFDFLLAITPINAGEAWERFRADGFRSEPKFRYRPLAVSTDDAKHRLYALPLDHLEDPVLKTLFREKQHEVDHQLTLLQCRNTPKFRDASRLLYGNVEPSLEKAARGLLAVTARESSLAGGTIGWPELKRAAEQTFRRYRHRYAGFDATVEIRDDIPPGLMVSGPHLLISSSTAMAKARVDALLQHEVGIHLVTYFAGREQGLALFRSGLAGYEGIQEGLGVFAEYAVGGLTWSRLRLLCGRVVACAAMLEGAAFPETFRLLTGEFDFSPQGAFNIALRVHRSGGLSKDAIYLKGLMDVLALLERGSSLEPFWLGKVSRGHLPVLSELEARGMLRPPPVKPEFLDRDDAQVRIERARQGLTLQDLVAA